MKSHKLFEIYLGETDQQVFDETLRDLINSLAACYVDLAIFLEDDLELDALEPTLIMDGKFNPRFPVGIQTIEFLEVINDAIVSFANLYGIGYIGSTGGHGSSISVR